MELKPIVYKKLTRDVDDFGNTIPEQVWCEGYSIEGKPGIFDSYTSAIAANMGLWEEYCEYHRNRIGK